MPAVPETEPTCCGAEVCSGEPFDPYWLGWLLDEAAVRGLSLVAMERVHGAWVEVAPTALLDREGLSWSVTQRIGCRGIRTRLEFGAPGGPDGGILAQTTTTGEPDAWRMLLLEALVLAAVSEPLAAK